MKVNLLKGKLKEFDMTQADAAEAIGCSLSPASTRS